LHSNTSARSAKVLFSILRNAKSESILNIYAKELFLLPVVFTIMPEPVNAGIDHDFCHSVATHYDEP
jgi:hypothetical protein